MKPLAIRSHAALVALALAAVSCQAVAGIRDRHLAGNAGTGGGGSAQADDSCRAYCRAVQMNCNDPNQDYMDEDTCLAVCSYLPRGKATRDAGTSAIGLNTLECRRDWENGAEPASDCPRAGPGGGDGVGSCGNNCESYCQLYAAVCTPYVSQILPDDECRRECAVLADDGTYNASQNFTSGGDTLQCRLAHLSAAAKAAHAGSKPAAELHCGHSRINVLNGTPTPCSDKAPDCNRYCALVQNVCSGDNQVYDDAQQCLTLCKTLDPGSLADQAGDTLGCRIYHTYNGLQNPTAPAVHCPHAGPGGGGACGDSCGEYCRILASACPDGFKQKYPGATDAAVASCTKQCMDDADLDADQSYAIGTADSSHPLQCRLHNAVQALDAMAQGEATSALCQNALGAGACKK